MNKLFLTAALLFPLLMQGQSDSKKMSFYYQAGHSSSNYLNSKARDHLVSTTESHDHKCIVFNVGTQWKVTKEWRLGAAFTYDHIGTRHRSLEYSNISYMLRGDRIWKAQGKFSYYSGLAAGITKVRKFESEKETMRKTKFGYQVYILGVSYEVIKNFQLEASAGYGSSGLFHAGARFNF